MSFDEFHDEIDRRRGGFAFGGLAFLLGKIEDLDDPRVLEAGCGAGFAAKTASVLGVPGQVFVQNLDGNFAAQHEILATIYRGHTALSDLLKEFVAARNCLMFKARFCHCRPSL